MYFALNENRRGWNGRRSEQEDGVWLHSVNWFRGEASWEQDVIGRDFRYFAIVNKVERLVSPFCMAGESGAPPRAWCAHHKDMRRRSRGVYSPPPASHLLPRTFLRLTAEQDSAWLRHQGMSYYRYRRHCQPSCCQYGSSHQWGQCRCLYLLYGIDPVFMGDRLCLGLETHMH